MPNTLAVKNLSCERGEQCLFDGLNFSLSSGEAMQVGGLNGVGKTSLLRLLAGLALINEGEVVWNEVSIHKQREDYFSNLIFIGHKLGLKGDLTAKENLYYSCNQYPGKLNCTVDEALNHMKMDAKAHLLVRDLSAGQKRRVVLAKLLLLPTPLWILDEPFTAIDKNGVAMLISLMQSHTQKGGMIIFTSHQPVALSKVHKELYLS